jgi:hypothetical protein
MGARYPDPWAPDPGFEPRTAPSARDEFAPVDLQTLDLRNFLRTDEVQRALGPPRQTVENVMILPDGSRGLLKQRAADDWELAIYLGRDYYEIFTGTHSKVLEAANATHRTNCSRPR